MYNMYLYAYAYTEEVKAIEFIVLVAGCSGIIVPTRDSKTYELKH